MTRTADNSTDFPWAIDSQWFAQLYEFTPSAMSINALRDGRFLSVNAAFERTTGYTRDEVLGRTSLELGLYADPSVRARMRERLEAGDIVEEFELVYVTKSGQQRIGLFAAQKVIYQGQPVLLAAMLDMTERARAEAALRQLTNELEDRVATRTAELEREITDRREAEAARRRDLATLATIFDILPFPIGILRSDLTWERMNTAAIRFLRDAGKTDPRQVTIFDARTQTIIPTEHWTSQAALRGESPEPYEAYIVMADGTRRPLMVHCAPVPREDDTNAAVVVLQDLTAVKESDRLKDEFLAIVSHDLLAPLTAIKSWARLAQTTTEPEIVQEGLDAIQQSVVMQQRLIDDLLDASALTAGRLQLSPELEVLWLQVRMTVAHWRAQAQERGLTLTINVPEEEMLAWVDAQRLRQILNNLLSNAIKYTPRGGEITVSLRRDDHWAEISVRDTGEGIAAHILPHVFDRFYHVRARNPLSRKGLGLGLAIVKALVDLHGGTITAHSDGPGQGSTFTVRLPLADEQDNR